MITRALLWIRSVLFRRRLEDEMRSEMAQHLERATARLEARGLAREDARREALHEFGRVSYLQEEGRIARGTHGLDSFVSDLRFAVRHFARNPLSTLTIVVVLSIGIAINVVMFTVVHSVTGQPPSGVTVSDDVVRIRGSQLRDGSRAERPFSLGEVEDYASLGTQFAALAAWTSQPVTASAPGVRDFTVTATFVSGDYFNLLGVQAVRGRTIAPGDAAPVALLSHAAWERSFSLDPDIIGRTILLADVPVTIVGIAPVRFRGAAWEARDDMQLWLPLPSRTQLFPDIPRDAPLFFAIARLQPGTTRAAADAAAKVVAKRSRAPKAPDSEEGDALLTRDPSVEVAPLLADNLEPGAEVQLRDATVAFAILGMLTLLVTCANVGSLQTGLALARRRELAIRLSLGAHRYRVVRQLVTESLFLALIAAGGAVLVTLLLIRALLMIVGAFSFELVFDETAVAFSFVMALLAGLLFGLSPALHATRLGVAPALRDAAGAVASGRTRLQRGLVVAQIALTQPLAVCLAALVVAAIAQYRDNPRNPNGEHIIHLRLSSAGAVAGGGAMARDRAALEKEGREREQLVDALRELPGVTHATLIPDRAPIRLEAFSRASGGMPGDEQGGAVYLVGRASKPGYLDLIGTPVVLGREIELADSAGVRARTIPVVVGEDMARRLWGSANPIGQRLQRSSDSDAMTLEVVGVYKSQVTALGHARNPFAVYVPPDLSLDSPATSQLILLRVSAPAESMTQTIREVVRAEAPRAAVMELRTLASLQDQERFILWGGIALFSGVGVVVLLLCALGLYAVIAFAVGQRTSEIAVRMAIGARARQIVRGFAVEGLRLSAIGVAVGLPISILGLRQLLSISPEVPDVSLPIVIAVVVIGVGGVAALASWIPARRAAAVDPAVILRRE